MSAGTSIDPFCCQCGGVCTGGAFSLNRVSPICGVCWYKITGKMDDVPIRPDATPLAGTARPQPDTHTGSAP